MYHIQIITRYGLQAYMYEPYTKLHMQMLYKSDIQPNLKMGKRTEEEFAKEDI